jgi:hypothetical protein
VQDFISEIEFVKFIGDGDGGDNGGGPAPDLANHLLTNTSDRLTSSDGAHITIS